MALTRSLSTTSSCSPFGPEQAPTETAGLRRPGVNHSRIFRSSSVAARVKATHGCLPRLSHVTGLCERPMPVHLRVAGWSAVKV